MDRNSTLKKEGADALLNSTGSTYIHTKESNVEIEPIGVIRYSYKYFFLKKKIPQKLFKFNKYYIFTHKYIYINILITFSVDL